jgi:hypothetical protein
MHHAIEPGVGAFLPGVLPHFAAFLNIAVPVITVIEPLLKILVAPARRENGCYSYKRESCGAGAQLEDNIRG